jgi:hypothetical protein
MSLTQFSYFRYINTNNKKAINSFSLKTSRKMSKIMEEINKLNKR